MKTEIENVIYNYADELKIDGQRESRIPHILIRVISAIALSDNKEELRSAISKITEGTELDEFSIYGYGAYRFWLTYRKLSNEGPEEYKLLKIEF